MPLVHATPTTHALSLSVSSPTSGSKKTVDGRAIPGLVIPIALDNNCTEQGVSIDSDNIGLTNTIRRHFLEHFGHRDVVGITADYAKDAIIIQVVNGEERTKLHGQDEVGRYFRDGIFALHRAGESSFQLKSITVKDRHAVVVWSAKTPSLVISQASDTFVFNSDDKIVKQYFTCQTHEREDPGTSRIVRKDVNAYGEFFA